MTIFKQGGGQVQFSKQQVNDRVQALGQEITAAYEGRPPHLICVLNGAFIFMAQLELRFYTYTIIQGKNKSS